MNHARRYSRHSVALRCLLCVAVAPAILVGCFRPDVPRGCDAAEQVNEILHWLPLDTETVVVANGPFKFANPPEDPPFCFNEAVRSLAFSCLLNERIAPKELIGQRIVIAMEGSRRFRSPRGLGMMPFEGCQVVIFDEDATPALTIAMQSLSRRAARTVELSGKEVAVFEHKSEQDTWITYMARPGPTILLCATDQDYMKAVIRQMESPPAARAMASSLPEWKQVNTNASVWAIRHYLKATAANDPSSPLRGKAAANVPDPGAIGFTFSYSRDRQRATAHYLTRSHDAVDIAKEIWRLLPESAQPRIEQPEPGVVEVTSAVDTDKSAMMFHFLLLARLGHAVYP